MTKEEDSLERFKQFLNIVKGRKDVKSRVQVLANPENLKTMSILTRSQAEFVAISHWASSVPEWGGMFKGLEDYSNLLMETSISVGGEGREQSIRFMGALSESKVLSKLGVNIAGEAKESKK